MILGLQGQELDNITAVVLFVLTVVLVLISYIANDSWSFRG